MFYKEICKPRPSDYNRNGKLSYEAILQILENVAGNHSANMGDSIADANKKENICAIPSGEQYECVKDNILSLIKKMDALTYESIL